MKVELFLSVAVSAGVGSAIVQLLLNLFLSHWLKQRYYEFTINKADKRACAEEILELINSKNYLKWYDLSDDIYNREYLISDRLLTLKEKAASKKLDEYANQQRYSKQVQDKVLHEDAQSNEAREAWVDSMSKVDKLREELIEIATKLRH